MKLEERGMAADLAELKKGIKDGELGLFKPASGDGLADLLVHSGTHSFVKVALG